MTMQSNKNAVTVAMLMPLLFSLLLVSCTSVSADGKVTLSNILTKTSIQVRDLDALDLDIKQGHGPVLWAALDKKTEVWFWYKPSVLSAAGLGKIVLIATVPTNDENNGTIVWPQDKIGHDYGKELEALYPR
jgi:hypothetical protein